MGATSLLLVGVLAATAAPPLGVARVAPADVDAVIQVRGVLAGREGAGAQMLRDAVQQLLRTTGAAAAWKDAAAASDLTPETLLHRCTGRDASLVVRRGPEDVEWVLALEMPRDEACELVKSAGGRVAGSKRFEIPGLGLAGSWHGDWLLVTDDMHSSLLRDMRTIGTERDMPTLFSSLPEDIRLDEESAVVVALRHAGRARGHSVWSLVPGRAGVHVEVDGAFEADPFGPAVEGPEPCLMLEAMPEETVACWMQQRPVQPFPRALADAGGSLDPMEAVRESLGQRMAVLVGPGKRGPMAVAVAYEVRDARAASEAHDAWLEAVARRIAADPEAPVQLRAASLLESPRDFTATGVAPLVFGELEPCADDELHARTVCLPSGGWRVYANERPWLARVVASLEEHPVQGTAPIGPHACVRSGFIQGAAMARAMRAWADQRAIEGRSDGGLRLLGSLGGLSDVVSWRLQQRSPGRFHAHLDISPATGTSEAAESSVAAVP